MAVGKEVLELDLYGLLGISERATEKEAGCPIRALELGPPNEQHPDPCSAFASGFSRSCSPRRAEPSRGHRGAALETHLGWFCYRCLHPARLPTLRRDWLLAAPWRNRGLLTGDAVLSQRKIRCPVQVMELTPHPNPSSSAAVTVLSGCWGICAGNDSSMPATPCGICAGNDSSTPAAPYGICVGNDSSTPAAPCGTCAGNDPSTPAAPCGICVGSDFSMAAAPCGICVGNDSSMPAAPCGICAGSDFSMAAAPCGICVGNDSSMPAAPCGICVGSDFSMAAAPCGICVGNDSSTPAVPWRNACLPAGSSLKTLGHPVQALELGRGHEQHPKPGATPVSGFLRSWRHGRAEPSRGHGGASSENCLWPSLEPLRDHHPGLFWKSLRNAAASSLCQSGVETCAHTRGA
ncbi:uncharacterized protein LOC128852226 [Cuculus canorus]|uniref:uncharacterized protein LOC128852226 n=1 Tax=Cuculus canorus TaxID=55661 RepID=UPI0023AAE6D0|nr:uncharacterized protein LOC128852226 [Cuculus canorus]